MCIKHNNFTTKYHDAWECNCEEVCKGQQFYANRRNKQMEYFKLHHNNQEPSAFLKLKTPNATLCHNCYWEYKTDLDLQSEYNIY